MKGFDLVPPADAVVRDEEDDEIVHVLRRPRLPVVDEVREAGGGEEGDCDGDPPQVAVDPHGLLAHPLEELEDEGDGEEERDLHVRLYRILLLQRVHVRLEELGEAGDAGLVQGERRRPNVGDHLVERPGVVGDEGLERPHDEQHLARRRRVLVHAHRERGERAREKGADGKGADPNQNELCY